MFENRKKNKIKKFFLFFSIIILMTFLIGYLINSGYGIKNKDNISKTSENIKIPKSLINYKKIDNNNESLYIVKKQTCFHYLTNYKMCGHKIEKNIIAPKIFLGLNIEDLKERIEGWELLEIKDDNIYFYREINTFCPDHFIIGVKDNNIAVYMFTEDGDRILKEKTDIDINVLTPEDQNFLIGGIVADTEDDMERKLEGFSN